MITTDTITDEQIRALRDVAVARFERGVDTTEDREAVQLFGLAMIPHMVMTMLSDEDHGEVCRARSRLAEILNRRNAGGYP